MKRIEVKILGKKYPLRVEESDVETTHEIARYVNQRMKKYRKQLPQQSITTVMVMAAMSLAEEAMESNGQPDESSSEERIGQINSQLEEILEDIGEINGDKTDETADHQE